MQAPANCKDSVKALATYLTSPFDSDLFKFRAIWRWVTSNIEYDTDVFFGNNISAPADDGNILQHGKGVCDAYASVVSELSRY